MTKIKRKCFFERKRLKQALILVGILLITLALSGCENFVETDVSAEETQIQTTISETTAAKSLKPKEPVEPIGEDSYGSPAYPLPDDWTFEKIVNLIEIDGTSFSFSSDIEDFNNINKKIKVERDKDFIGYYDIYYDNKHIIKANKSQKKSDMSVIVSYPGNDQKITDAITFAGYSLQEVNEIYEYMDTNFNVSQSGESGKRYSFINDKIILELSFLNSSINLNKVMLVLSIKEEE